MFSKMQVKNTFFWSREGLQHNVFFITCVLQNVKVIVFGPFLPIFVAFKKHYKNRYFSTFAKAKKQKAIHFEGVLSGPSRNYYLLQ